MNNLKYNNVEDRKELYNILCNYMDERDRALFLEWACKQVNTDLNRLLRPGKSSIYSPFEVYWQIMSLAFMHHADLEKIMHGAVHFARKGRINEF